MAEGFGGVAYRQLKLKKSRNFAACCSGYNVLLNNTFCNVYSLVIQKLIHFSDLLNQSLLNTGALVFKGMSLISHSIRYSFL